jgi:hypothetical protein
MAFTTSRSPLHRLSFRRSAVLFALHRLQRARGKGPPACLVNRSVQLFFTCMESLIRTARPRPQLHRINSTRQKPPILRHAGERTKERTNKRRVEGCDPSPPCPASARHRPAVGTRPPHRGFAQRTRRRSCSWMCRLVHPGDRDMERPSDSHAARTQRARFAAALRRGVLLLVALALAGELRNHHQSSPARCPAARAAAVVHPVVGCPGLEYGIVRLNLKLAPPPAAAGGMPTLCLLSAALTSRGRRAPPLRLPGHHRVHVPEHSAIRLVPWRHLEQLHILHLRLQPGAPDQPDHPDLLRVGIRRQLRRRPQRHVQERLQAELEQPHQLPQPGRRRLRDLCVCERLVPESPCLPRCARAVGACAPAATAGLHWCGNSCGRMCRSWLMPQRYARAPHAAGRC